MILISAVHFANYRSDPNLLGPSQTKSAKNTFDPESPVFFGSAPYVPAEHSFAPLLTLHVHSLSPFFQTAGQKEEAHLSARTTDSGTRDFPVSLIASELETLRANSNVSLSIKHDDTSRPAIRAVTVLEASKARMPAATFASQFHFLGMRLFRLGMGFR